MSVQLGNVCFDCDQPETVAAFWSDALGLAIDDGASPDFCSLSASPPGSGPNWFFAKVPEARTSKNRVHVDLVADAAATEVERLIGLGATVVASKQEWGHSWTVLADVEGNEFCLSEG